MSPGLHVGLGGQADLSEVVLAGEPPAAFPHALHGGQEQTEQVDHDQDHYQEFDERDTGSTLGLALPGLQSHAVASRIGARDQGRVDSAAAGAAAGQAGMCNTWPATSFRVSRFTRSESVSRLAF
jgi:hypothetical protein